MTSPAAPVAHSINTDEHTVTLSVMGATGPRSRLIIDTSRDGVWVFTNRSSVTSADAAALGGELRVVAPEGTELLLWDVPSGSAFDRIARAGGWRLRTVKVFVERNLTTLGSSTDPVTARWALTTLADVGLEEFAALLLRASEGDPFETSTAESATSDLQALIDGAGDAFDPTQWVIASDGNGVIGAVLPQRQADAPKTGTIFYMGVIPERRTQGHGARLHMLGLQRLRRLGVDKYVGSTDQQNTAMIQVFRQNGTQATRTQTYYTR